jgi:hypothetical protein
MGDHARGCRLRVGVTISFIAPWDKNQGRKVAGPCKRCKKAQ